MRRLTLCLIGLVAASALGCIQHDGQLAILMTSSGASATSAAVRQVNVEVTSVELWDSDSKSFVTLSGTSQVHELLGLDGRVTPLALTTAIEQGTYTQVRINFENLNSSVVLDPGRREPLRIEPRTVTVPTLVTVVEDSSVDALVEIDLAASLSLKSNGTWVFRPVARQIGG